MVLNGYLSLKRFRGDGGMREREREGGREGGRGRGREGGGGGRKDYLLAYDDF